MTSAVSRWNFNRRFSMLSEMLSILTSTTIINFLILNLYTISFEANSVAILKKLLSWTCNVDKKINYFTFENIVMKKRKTIFIVWLVRSKLSFVWKWYVVLIKNLVFILMNIACHKFDKNFEFLFDMIFFDILQSAIRNAFSNKWIQSTTMYVVLFRINNVRRKNLFVIVMSAS